MVLEGALPVMRFIIALLFLICASDFALAAPQPWALGFQNAYSPVAHKVHEFSDMMLYIMFGIVIFVLFLLAYVSWRFRESKNPVPSRVSHNTLLEIIWTAVPVLLLVVILIPSMRLLYFTDVSMDTDFTVKITGHQWYWSYEYPDHGSITFDSYMVADKDLKQDQKRLLDVDNPLVLPVGTKVKFILTSADVIHSWAMPALAIKTDTVPGRLNEEGTYYGQCSEICGVGHGFMPIVIKAVSISDFSTWVQKNGGTIPSKKNL
jgi:cytochrome c oxidase subunit 2